MRIALVSQEYPPETGWGGIGTYVGIIAPALAAAGAEVHVLSVVVDQDATDIERDGVCIHRRPLKRPRGVGRISRLPDTWDRLSVSVGASRELARLDLDADVVEYPEWMAEGAMAAVRRTTPMVVRLHSSAAQVFPFLGPVGFDQQLSISLENRVITRAHVVTGTAPQIVAARDRLQLDPARSLSITYPVRPVPTTDVPPNHDVMFAGRFEHRKGADTLVAALPKLVARVPTARLVLVGRDTSNPEHPSMADYLRAQAAAAGVGDSLEIVERWGSDAVAEAATKASVVAVPSRWESFGYVAAEASALGRPVVASAIPSLAEVVTDGETGRLVDPEAPDKWADALGDLLSDRDTLADMGAAGAQRMAQTCDPSLVADQTIQAYELAIGVAGVAR